MIIWIKDISNRNRPMAWITSGKRARLPRRLNWPSITAAAAFLLSWAAAFWSLLRLCGAGR
jgi:membrane-associated phospholipid phosphatase